MNINVTTGDAYQGKNQAFLMQRKDEKGFTSEVWGTFLQWKKDHKHVRKGEKGITLCKPIHDVKLDKDGNEIDVTNLKLFTVFNIEQTQETAEEEVA